MLLRARGFGLGSVGCLRAGSTRGARGLELRGGAVGAADCRRCPAASWAAPQRQACEIRRQRTPITSLLVPAGRVSVGAGLGRSLEAVSGPPGRARRSRGRCGVCAPPRGCGAGRGAWTSVRFLCQLASGEPRRPLPGYRLFIGLRRGKHRGGIAHSRCLSLVLLPARPRRVLPPPWELPARLWRVRPLADRLLSALSLQDLSVPPRATRKRMMRCPEPRPRRIWTRHQPAPFT